MRGRGSPPLKPRPVHTQTGGTSGPASPRHWLREGPGWPPALLGIPWLESTPQTRTPRQATGEARRPWGDKQPRLPRRPGPPELAATHAVGAAGVPGGAEGGPQPARDPGAAGASETTQRQRAGPTSGLCPLTAQSLHPWPVPGPRGTRPGATPQPSPPGTHAHAQNRQSLGVAVFGDSFSVG